MVTLTHCKDQQLAVVGLGRAGLATIKALRAGGAVVHAWDDQPQARERAAERKATITSIEDMPWNDIQSLVLSPGIPLTHPEPHPAVHAARKAGCEIIGDIELLYRQQPEATYIGITGTNGKSTTAVLTHHLLRKGGVKAELGGNIGIPALDLPPLGEQGAYVLELSSYQLDLVDQLHCNHAIWLNISPDHLDRHGDMPGYINAKQRIFRHLEAGDNITIGIDDPYSHEVYERYCRKLGKKVTITPISQDVVRGGIEVSEESVTVPVDGEALRFMLDEMPALKGRHNAQNVAAAANVALTLDVSPEAIRKGLKSFPGLEHRLEPVMTYKEIMAINDSKATNPEAAAKALAAYRRIYWIAGGVPKSDNWEMLKPYAPHIIRAYMIGQAAPSLMQAASQWGVPAMQSGSLEAAVSQAVSDAMRTNTPAVILLSPACASFDQFSDFEDRGRQFKKLIHKKLGKSSG